MFGLNPDGLKQMRCDTQILCIYRQLRFAMHCLGLPLMRELGEAKPNPEGEKTTPQSASHSLADSSPHKGSLNGDIQTIALWTTRAKSR